MEQSDNEVRPVKDKEWYRDSRRTKIIELTGRISVTSPSESLVRGLSCFEDRITQCKLLTLKRSIIFIQVDKSPPRRSDSDWVYK